MAVNWNNLSKDKAEELLATDFSKGLSQKAAKERYKQLNYKASLQKKSLKRTDSTLDWFSFAVLLLISFVSYFVMPVWKAVFFSVVCIFAILILIIVDEYSKKRISSHLNFFTSYVTVLRDGKQISIPSSFVVTGDVLKLKSGDIVPCDCFVIEKKNFKTSKNWPDSEKIIYANEKVESGSCICASVLSASDASKNAISDLQDDFITSSDIYKITVRISSFALILISLFAIVTLFVDILLKKEAQMVFFDFSSYFVIACGVLASSVSLLFKFSFCFLSLRELEEKGTHIKNASALDYLSRIKCAVLDTDMFFNMDNPNPIAFYTNNDILLKENIKMSEVRSSSFFRTLLSTEINSSLSSVADKYSVSLQKCFGKEFVSDDKLISYRFKDDDFPFDTFLFESASGQKYATVKGELSSLIRCCTTISLGNKAISFDDGLKNTVLSAASSLNSMGCEIVAYAKNSEADISLDNTHLSHKRLTFLGFVSYAVGQAASCDEFFSLCERLDIEPVLIHYGTANELNMYIKSSEHFRKRSFVDCKKIGEGIENIKNVLSKYDGFINPSEKQHKALLKALSQNNIKYAYISRQNEKGHKKEEQADLIFDNCTDYNREGEEADCKVKYSLYSLASVISSAIKTKSRAKKILNFVAFLCFTKAFLVPLGLFTDTAVFSPLKTAILVFVFDLLSIFIFIDNKKIKDISLNKHEWHFSLKAISVFALLPLFVLFISKLFSLFSYDSELSIIASVSFFSQLLLPCFYLIFKEKLQMSEKLLFYLFSILIFITLCVMFTPFGKLFGVISDVKILIASIIASVIFFLGYCKLYKNITNIKK